MAGYGLAAFLLAVAVQLHGGIAAKLTPELSVVRREPHSVVLSALGELLQEGENADPAPAPALATETDADADADAEADTEMGKLCNTDFFLGEDGKQSCPGGDVQLLLDRAICMEAARESGATYQHSEDDQHAGIPQDDQRKYPRGCFKLPHGHTSETLKDCSSSSSDAGCYYYNGIEGNAVEPSDSVTGQTVCARPKHGHGKRDTDGGCPDGYEVINDATTCWDSARCFSEIDAHIKFVVGEKRRTDFHDLHQGEEKSPEQHPQGCFLIEEESNTGKKVFKAHYNVASPTADGGSVKGTNLCKVSPQKKGEAKKEEGGENSAEAEKKDKVHKTLAEAKTGVEGGKNSVEEKKEKKQKEEGNAKALA